MIKTKDLFKKKLDSQSKINNIAKLSLAKKMMISAILSVVAVASWDIAVLSSDVVKINKIADYKVNHYKALSDYSNFKSQIDNVSYTDAQFNKDLKVLDAIYNHPNNVVYNKVMRNVSQNYGSFLGMLVVGDGKYINQENTYNHLLSITKDISQTEMNNPDSNINKEFNETFNMNKVGKDNRYAGALSEMKMSVSYAGFSEGITLNKKLYENMNSYLKEEGFGENILFISPELALSRGDRSKDIKDFYEQVRMSTQKANSELESIYRSGDKDKLRKLLQMSYAFKYLISVQIVETINNVGHIQIPYLYQIIGNSDNGYGLANSVKWITQMKGDYTPENSLYYNDDYFFWSLYH